MFLADGKKCYTDVDQRSSTLKWKKKGYRSPAYLEMLAEMSELTARDRLEYSPKVEKVDVSNMKSLLRLMNAHQEFFLVVEHDVIVEKKKIASVFCGFS